MFAICIYSFIVHNELFLFQWNKKLDNDKNADNKYVKEILIIYFTVTQQKIYLNILTFRYEKIVIYKCKR